MPYIAHKDKDGKTQTLLDHLTGTAELARRNAEPFGAGDIAYRCGLLHDIGKYSEKFQRRINGENVRVDHSTAGALTLFQLEKSDFTSALCIAGHHTGLLNYGNKYSDVAGEPTFEGRMKCRPGREIEDFSAFRQELTIPAAAMPAFVTDFASAFMFTHMLFSCLVDADWLDTESFMSLPRTGLGEPLTKLMQRLETRMQEWQNPQSDLNIKRCQILQTLLDSASQPRGLFSLTVPTGGGKTMSSVAFALRHALAHGMRRVIYVIPYTSILEQTKSEFEKTFGQENVVAHYANVDYSRNDEDSRESETERKHRLATENWDAPIILTTSVQFFDSLFSNKKSRCRKLHNIAASTIIFDEAQMLPVGYLHHCIWAISELVRNYRCSAVLCTATQPALGKLVEQYLSDWPIHELCPDVSAMHESFRGVSYQREGKLSDEALAMRLNEEERVLCVVNNRKQAQKIFALLSEEGSYHLSTTMTPEDRRTAISEIKQRLKHKQTCRVVSTSLIEAGVDVDFPTVWRAMAGLDSIIQSGGRCNRERKRPASESIVHIFETEAEPPKAMQQNLAAAEKTMQNFDDISSPKAIEGYFNLLYHVLKDDRAKDLKGIMGRISSGEMPFDAISKDFKLIESDDDTVYVPQDAGAELTEHLIKEGPNRGLMRQLGQYSVSVHRDYFNKLRSSGAIESVSDGIGILRSMELYSKKTGLSFDWEGGQGNFR